MIAVVVMGVVMNTFGVVGVGGLNWSCERRIEMYRSS